MNSKEYQNISEITTSEPDFILGTAQKNELRLDFCLDVFLLLFERLPKPTLPPMF